MCKAYGSGNVPKKWPYMVQYLHCRILGSHNYAAIRVFHSQAVSRRGWEPGALLFHPSQGVRFRNDPLC